MRHVIGDARIPEIREDRLAAERLHGCSADKSRRGVGHHDAHIDASLDEQASQFGGLVGRHPTGQSE